MTAYPLPASIEDVLSSQQDPEAVLTALLPNICEVLQTDRCFIHLRNPHTRMYRNICWRRSSEIPDTSTAEWEFEQEWEREDPMFAAALRTDNSIFVEDVEKASPDVLNIEFERKYLGHRAVIHAHLCKDGMLWGILQPSIFGRARVWSDRDRAVVKEVVSRITPLAIAIVEAANV